MEGIVNVITLLDGQTAAGAGTARKLNWRGSLSPVRAVAGTLAAGDSVAVEVSIDGDTWIVQGSFNTPTFGATIEGTWVYARAVKTGTNGPATAKIVG